MSPMNRLNDTSEEKTSFFDEIKELDHALDFQKACVPNKAQDLTKYVDDKSYLRYVRLENLIISLYTTYYSSIYQ